MVSLTRREWFTQRGYEICPSCGQFVWMQDGLLPVPHDVWSPERDRPEPCDRGLLMPEEWQRRTGVTVRRPSGWQGGFNDTSWEARIPRHEFLRRAMVSDTDPWPVPLHDERPAPWRPPAVPQDRLGVTNPGGAPDPG